MIIASFFTSGETASFRRSGLATPRAAPRAQAVALFRMTYALKTQFWGGGRWFGEDMQFEAGYIPQNSLSSLTRNQKLQKCFLFSAFLWFVYPIVLSNDFPGPTQKYIFGRLFSNIFMNFDSNSFFQLQ